jgi:hypothetical protein
MNLTPSFPYKVALAVVVVGGVAFFYMKRDGAAPLAQQIGEAAAGAVVDAGKGVVFGIGDAIGVPRTNETECEKAIREGRTWDASFACPAGTFIKSVWPW